MAYDQEGIKPYDDAAEKGEQVRRMFDRLAPSYDLLNHMLSLGIDKSWRRKAVDTLAAFRPQHILDVATGTGDFAQLLLQRLQPEHLVGCDISEGMMQVALDKVKDARVTFQREDCMELTFADNTFDAVTSAYGVRNFADLERGLTEMYRVLRPGGRLLVLELTAPRRFPMRQLFWIYSHVAMPVIGRIISGDDSAYTYLPATMEAFPQGEKMMDILTRIGFAETSFRRYTFGICTLVMACK